MVETKKTMHAARIAACVLIVAALTMAFGWFAGRAIPAQPSVVQQKDGPASLPIARLAKDADAFSIEDAAAGKTFSIGPLTLSSAYFGAGADGVETVAAKYLGDEGWQVLKSGEPWETAVPAFSARVASAKALTGDAFAQWYPDYANLPEGLSSYGDYETKFIVVEMEMQNEGEEAMRAFIPWLWGDTMLWASDSSILGMRMPSSLGEELYGMPADSPNTRQHTLSDDWDVINPGETREFTLVYPVYRSCFADAADFDDIDLSRLYVEFIDCGSKMRYRFYLA